MGVPRSGALLLAAAVLVAGCAPDTGPTPPAAPPAPTATSPAPSADPSADLSPTTSGAPPTTPDAAPAPSPTPSPSPSHAPGAGPDLDDPASLAVVVNKRRPLVPEGWAPADLEDVEGHLLRPGAAAAARGMLAAARADGVPLRIVSGYRSWTEQAGTYAGWVARKGPEAADTVSARPGHSEHQTGLAVDVGDGSGCDLRVCFADTAAAAWVAEHGPEHGFVVRYPRGEHGTTGYWYEPWHLRYLGPERARELERSGVPTLEEFSGLGPAPDYGTPAPG
ncbi:D-alanyl-D-alanine carboxypeptidase family protein [Kocuria kalidii]|uniref:M15 family metallopeptidase n=1 Tax=Kocuria kalidii TaxID=3376283 RepID=UPI00379B51F3